MHRLAAALLILPLAGATERPAFPPLTGSVVDAADILPRATEEAIAVASAVVERRIGHQFVVATVPSLGGRPIEEYSRALFNHWGIGRRGVNDGIGLLVAPTERRIRIEVARGLERTVTDAEAKTVIDRRILPAFRVGDYSAGILRGSAGIVRELAEGAS